MEASFILLGSTTYGLSISQLLSARSLQRTTFFPRTVPPTGGQAVSAKMHVSALVTIVRASLALLSLTLGAADVGAYRRLQQLSTNDPAPEDTIICDYAVIGGGPGGVYSAYRLLEERISDNVCLFEATHRVGGRVYSVRGLGPNKDLVLDAGAYRYMPQAQPIITSLIENDLELPNRLYQPGVSDYKIILTPEGESAGFATYVEAMFARAVDAGLKPTFNSRIVQMLQIDEGFMLINQLGVRFMANSVILNIASRPLTRLLQNSVLPSAAYASSLDTAWVQRATKLYVFYPRAWWTAAGLYNGSFEDTPAWEEGVVAPIVARYHDGPVKCASRGGNGYTDFFYQLTSELDVHDCYGYIQMTYTSDDGSDNTTHEAVDYLSDFMGSLQSGNSGLTDVPYAIINSSTYGGAHLLQMAHQQLASYHEGQNLTLTDGDLPTEAFISLWDPAITWVSGAWHSMKVESNMDPLSVRESLKPFPDLELYVANEAYSTVQGWSEGSLAMAENIIREYLGGGLPAWLSEDQWQRANFTSPTFDDYEGAPQGGGGTSAQGLVPAMAPAPAPSVASVAANSVG